MSGAVTINGNTVDVSSLGEAPHARFSNYLFIQGTRAILAADKRKLLELKVTVYEYLGNHCYLCGYPQNDLQPIRNLDFIEFATVYSERVKVSAFLQEARREAQMPSADQSAAAPTTFSLEVLLHKGEDEAQTAQKIADKTGISASSMTIAHSRLLLVAQHNDIDEISKIDAVRAIEHTVPKILYNNFARGDVSVPNWDTDSSLPPSLTSSKYEGQGQVIAVADTGFDIGDISNVHPAFTGRVQALIATARPDTQQTNDFKGHGTHVCGSVLGDGLSKTMGGKIRGTAPQAKLVVQSLMTNRPHAELKTPPNLWDLLELPYKMQQARIATNSWGPAWQEGQKKPIGYDAEAGSIDRFVWHNQDHVILFAAGNDGQQESETQAQIGSSSAAKNIICVGATESSRGAASNWAYTPPVQPGQPNIVAAFSSSGPTREHRLKPDVVAPGVAILSAATRDPGLTEQTRNAYGTSSDTNWMFDTGTSMATPLVAGCCAVIREAVQTHTTATPSAALVKALLINGAIDLGLPNSRQGFGRVNVTNSLNTVENQGHGGVQGYADIGYPTTGKLEEGQTWTTEVAFPATLRTGTFNVTLAYSDRYGPALQNNLKLMVTAAISTGETVVKSGQVGNLGENNAERVSLDMAAGYQSATITITAERIARLDDSQAFALAWGAY